MSTGSVILEDAYLGGRVYYGQQWEEGSVIIKEGAMVMMSSVAGPEAIVEEGAILLPFTEVSREVLYGGTCRLGSYTIKASKSTGLFKSANTSFLEMLCHSSGLILFVLIYQSI